MIIFTGYEDKIVSNTKADFCSRSMMLSAAEYSVGVWIEMDDAGRMQ